MVGASPGWADTTVRWLRTNHPEYVVHSSRKSFKDQLAGALVKMCLSLKPGDSATSKVYIGRMKDLAGKWEEADFISMKEFLASGGYSGMIATLAAATDKFKVVVGTKADSCIVDEFGIEFEEIEQQVSPKSQVSPYHELEEIVNSAVLAQDPRYGAC